LNSKPRGAPFFKLAQRIDPGRRGNAPGIQMFSDTRRFELADAERGWLRTDFGVLAETGVALWRVRSSGHTIELSEPNNITILAPTQGRVDVEVGAEDFGASPGEALLFGPNRRLTHVRPATSNRYDCAAIMIPLDAIGWEQPGRQEKIMPYCDPGLISFVNHLYSELRRGVSPINSARGQAAAASLLLEYVRANFAPLDIDAASGPSELCLVEEIFHERFGDPLTISLVAREVGISERALQLAYRRYRGTTPREALNRIRMDAARNRLLSANPEDTISQVALDCGFAHVGRFSVAYRERFGESPSQTWRRSR
jgi:AraC-like DNA-binding protein